MIITEMRFAMIEYCDRIIRSNTLTKYSAQKLVLHNSCTISKTLVDETLQQCLSTSLEEQNRKDAFQWLEKPPVHEAAQES